MLLANREGHAGASSWGLVLAAGDGRRLQSHIRRIIGKDLPKQYVNFIGARSMLQHTFDRIEKLIAARRILTVVSKEHLRFGEVGQQLSRLAPENIIVQPANKETGPGVFLPLMHLYKRCPEAIVTVFPSDHFILQEERFMDHVALAVRAVAHEPSRIVLLAMEAQGPEVEYGYIVPHADNGAVNLWGLREAAQFVEKPQRGMARKLLQAGALWNTMIMVFKVKTILEMLQRFFPAAYNHFAAIHDAIGSAAETETVEGAYRALEPMNFSKDFLEKIALAHPGRISLLPVLQVFWSDWGSAARIIQVQQMLARENRAHHPRKTTRGKNRSGLGPLLWQDKVA